VCQMESSETENQSGCAVTSLARYVFVLMFLCVFCYVDVFVRVSEL
jgi:hypothetical protein